MPALAEFSNAVLRCKTAGIEHGYSSADIIKLCEPKPEVQAKMEECIIKLTKNFTTSYLYSSDLVSVCSQQY